MISKLSKQITDLLNGRSGTTIRQAQAVCAEAEAHADPLHLDMINHRFSGEMFAQLLLELPRHRRTLYMAHTTGDHAQLRACVHQVLGAVVYCNEPGLEQALRTLQHTLKYGDTHAIDSNLRGVIDTIDATLAGSGYRAD